MVRRRRLGVIVAGQHRHQDSAIEICALPTVPYAGSPIDQGNFGTWWLLDVHALPAGVERESSGHRVGVCRVGPAASRDAPRCRDPFGPRL